MARFTRCLGDLLQELKLHFGSNILNFKCKSTLHALGSKGWAWNGEIKSNLKNGWVQCVLNLQFGCLIFPNLSKIKFQINKNWIIMSFSRLNWFHEDVSLNERGNFLRRDVRLCNFSNHYTIFIIRSKLSGTNTLL